MSNHDLDLGGSEDAIIRKLFREWRGALAAADEGGLDEAVFEERMRSFAFEITRTKIAEARVVGAAGLAIKAFLAAHNERGPDGEILNSALLSLVEHGPRFVPELAPFADKILAAGAGREEAAERASGGSEDDAIYSLFRRWIHGKRAAQLIVDESENGDELTAANERLDNLTRAIGDLRAQGVVGLAIKSYLALHSELHAFEAGCDSAGLRSLAEDGDRPHVVAAMLPRCRARFIPEIAQFVPSVDQSRPTRK